MNMQEFKKKYGNKLIFSLVDVNEAVFNLMLLNGILSNNIRIMTDFDIEYCTIKLYRRDVRHSTWKIVFEETVGIKGGLYTGALMAAWEFCNANN